MLKFFFALLIPITIIIFIIFGRDASLTPVDNAEEVVTDPGSVPTPVTPFPTELPSTVVTGLKSLPHANQVSPGFWHLEGTAVDADAGFSILYNDFNQSFAVSIWKEPLAKSREAAGDYLLQITGVSESDLCARNVYVGVVDEISSELSRQNLRLDFCPNAIEL